MGENLFAALDFGLPFAVVFGLGVWQLVAVRRSIRRDREASGQSPRKPGDA
ncbi:hypothetical protein SAMN05216360_106207 [Methylobacterium phyllostachyos]|uniref:Heme exporter protein D n=1 Tax=Methylobacterium phyllostachyos TaxID=582672 RepID=A0A1G9ZEI9_9HYPH|nr:hypothetical protein [Methylobacterium phyllostachyos]SDN18863.1 hypothetical protein SAMN05216360_106207 [Methylobacterium phyllostachyos]